MQEPTPETLRRASHPKQQRTARTLGIVLLSLTVLALFTFNPALGQNLGAPRSLKTVPIPEPPNLLEFVKDKQAAIALGKALFWDMQVGSDGVQACATCHFHAGADSRTKNVVNPGHIMGDGTFQSGRPNSALIPSMFPFHKLTDPMDRFSPLIFSTNDVVSSPGVHHRQFVRVHASGSFEIGNILADPVFSVSGLNTRRVEPRNAPTVINSVFNYANFWDGRANNIFNGVSPFGDSDPNAFIFIHNDRGRLVQRRVRIPMASLASQAVGPPGSDFEMSYSGRGFPHIARKLLRLVPLAKQRVHPGDSVLGPLAKPDSTGLQTTYLAMVRAAFHDKYWKNNTSAVRVKPTTGKRKVIPRSPILGRNQFSQVEVNFSLFFGLAVQLYEATLVSDDSPFDRFQEGDVNAMSASAQAGLNIFLAPGNEVGGVGGNCINCHGGSEFSNASVSHALFVEPSTGRPEGLLERMAGGDGAGAFYDSGYYNVGVRPIEEDLGRGGKDPFGYPLSFSDRALLVDRGKRLPFENPPLPCGAGQPSPCPLQRTGTRGAFKTPSLRNVELTGPYLHNGGEATLMQVVDFYTRGGDFHEQNLSTLAPDIELLVGLSINEHAQDQLVDFLMALTDERVRKEQAPFDHPELFIPNGAAGNTQSVRDCGGVACDDMLRLPQVGAGGRQAEGLPPVGTFLGLDPHQP